MSDSRRYNFEYKLFKGPLFIVPLLMSVSCLEGEIQVIGDEDSGSYVSGVVPVSSGSSAVNGEASSGLITVSFIVEAENWNPANTDYPIGFQGSPLGREDMLGDTFTGSYANNVNYSAQFNYSYPQNNFRLSSAQLIIDTEKDDTDTEAIVVDGVYNGYTVGNEHSSSFVTDDFSCLIASGQTDANHCLATGNYYYSEYTYTHYSINERNTIDLDIQDIYADNSIADEADRNQDSYQKLFDKVSDGNVELFLGDDSPIYKAYLVITGLTVGEESQLPCVVSPEYNFQNTYVHNDGSSTNLNMFTGSTITTKQAADGSAGNSVQFHFDQTFPRVDDDNLTVTNAKIAIQLQRNGTQDIALVANGRAIGESGFNQTSATSNVVQWVSDSTSIAAFDADLSGVSSSGFTTVELDLNSYFGVETAKQILLEGKLNITLSGVNLNGSPDLNKGYTMGGNLQGIRETNWRAFRQNVSGPELKLSGLYKTLDCQIIDNPDSPLTQTSGNVVADDGNPPVISSVQVTEVSSNSAKIVWLTNESASSRVFYGPNGNEASTTIINNASLYHEVTLENLSPYTFYRFQVESIDASGAVIRSDFMDFLTKR